SELVCLLFDIELLQLNAPIVQRCAEHDRLCRSIAPCKPGQFAPERRGYPAWFGKVSAKSEVTSVEQTADAIGESECFRRLLERNIRGASGNLPVGMLRSPFVRNVSTNFSAERVGIELQTHALVSQTRQVRRSGLQIQTAR